MDIDVNERNQFRKMMRELRFPAYAIPRLDEMYKRPGEDYVLRCKSIGIAFPLDATEINLALKFSAHPKGLGFSPENYTASIHHTPSRSLREHTFSIRPDNTFHIDKAFAMLDGRPIEILGYDGKGEVTRQWEQFDFKNREQNGQYKILRHDFNLASALSQTPFIKDISREQFSELCDQMQSGELASVHLKSGAQIYLIPNPSGKDILTCTAEGKVLTARDIKPKQSIYNSIVNRLRRRRGRGI